MVLRRIRGLFGTAIVWGFVWMPIGIVLGLYTVHTYPPGDLLPAPPTFPGVFVRVVTGAAASWATWGAINGGVFSLVLAIAERRTEFGALSVPRMALWGAVGAAILPFVTFGLLMILDPGIELVAPAVLTFLLSAGLGAGCAAGTLILARRPPRARVEAASTPGRLTSA